MVDQAWFGRSCEAVSLRESNCAHQLHVGRLRKIPCRRVLRNLLLLVVGFFVVFKDVAL